MGIRTDTLNSRNYATQYRIAESALKTIAKIKEAQDESLKNHGNIFTDCAYLDYIFFQPPDLLRIAYDYTFSALENFLEHVGFILFDNWESNKSQRHYTKKQERLLNLNDASEIKHLPNINYQRLESQWKQIIGSIDFSLFVDTRNLIKHIHSGAHDGIKKIVQTTSPQMNTSEFDQLVKGTSLEITENVCINFLFEVDSFIKKVHEFISDNKLMFRIYCEPQLNDKLEVRKNLLSIFLTNPLATDLYSSAFAL